MTDDTSSQEKQSNEAQDREKLLEKLKQETSKLTLSDVKPAPSAVPKTIQLKRPDSAPMGPASPKIVQDEPSADMIDSLDASIAEDMKKVTSRILLEDVLPQESSDPRSTTMPVMGLRKPPSTRMSSAVPKTIKLKRPPLSTPAQRVAASPTRPPTQRVSSAKADTSPLGEAPTIIKRPAVLKRDTSFISVGDELDPDSGRKQTSRISIEPQPKTIQLRRTTVAPAVTGGLAETVKKSETAKISSYDHADAPVTQRKTIRIKRPDQQAQPEVSDAQSASDSLPAFQRRKTGLEEQVEESVNVVFAIAAVLA
ncbi:MAG: hypothetical protein GX811_09005, partial [Lentisphaerae bacterium]|nr:hypothetical protein [Lentisphaerota bacterium]